MIFELNPLKTTRLLRQQCRLFVALGLSVMVSVTSAVELPVMATSKPADKTFTLAQPLPVSDRNNRAQLLVGMEEGALRIAFPNMPGAEAIVPLDDPSLYFNVTPPGDFAKTMTNSYDENHPAVLRSLEPIGPSLLRYVNLPPERANFAFIGELYYRALVEIGPLERTLDLTLQMPTKNLPIEYIDHMRSFTYRAIGSDRSDMVEKLLARLFLIMPEKEFATFAFGVADRLRARGESELVGKIYGTLAQSSDEELRQRSLLWAVYTYAVLGDAVAARSILNDVDEPETSSVNFSRYCLARGRLAMLEDNNAEALEYISRAMVLTTIQASFKPELYYLLSRAYRIKGDDDADKTLGLEFSLFFPDSPWLERLEAEQAEALEALKALEALEALEIDALEKPNS